MRREEGRKRKDEKGVGKREGSLFLLFAPRGLSYPRKLDSPV